MPEVDDCTDCTIHFEDKYCKSIIMYKILKYTKCYVASQMNS